MFKISRMSAQNGFIRIRLEEGSPAKLFQSDIVQNKMDRIISVVPNSCDIYESWEKR
jgi:hypothetical protein